MAKKESRLKIIIGHKAYKGKHDYYCGLTGTIHWCKCCGQNRIQFDDIANSEYLHNFDLTKCAIEVKVLPLKKQLTKKK